MVCTDGLLVTDDRAKAGQPKSRARSAFSPQKNRLYLGKAEANVGRKEAELEGEEGRAGEWPAVFTGGSSQPTWSPPQETGGRHRWSCRALPMTAEKSWRGAEIPRDWRSQTAVLIFLKTGKEGLRSHRPTGLHPSILPSNCWQKFESRLLSGQLANAWRMSRIAH